MPLRPVRHEGELLRELTSGSNNDPELLREVREQLLPGGSAAMLTIVSRAVARGQARPEALTPRIATVAIDLLRHEYLAHGTTAISEATLVEIVDQIFLPLAQR